MLSHLYLLVQTGEAFSIRADPAPTPPVASIPAPSKNFPQSKIENIKIDSQSVLGCPLLTEIATKNITWKGKMALALVETLVKIVVYTGLL